MESDQKSYDIAVIGGGVFGAWSAYQLRLRGHSVLLIDAFGSGNNRSSSGGESRATRCGYGDREIYTKMAWQSLASWKRLFASAAAGRTLFYKIGMLWLGSPGHPHLEGSRTAMRNLGIPFEDLDFVELKHRYPQISIAADTVGIFEPEAGALMARQAVATVAAEFRRIGGRIVIDKVLPPSGTGTLQQIDTVQGHHFTASKFIFACGPWLPKVLPSIMGNRISPSRQEVIFWGTTPGTDDFEPQKMPVWIDYSDDRGFYGFPNLEARGFKVAFDNHGPSFDPDSDDRIVPSERIAAARAYVAERFPALAGAPVAETRVCQYENSSDNHFVIDRHPEIENVWVVGGGSGHGFKHGPAVGEYVADLITGQREPEYAFLLRADRDIRQHAAV